MCIKSKAILLKYLRPVFSIEHRMKLLKTITKNIGDVEIVTFDGLLADFVDKHQIDFMVPYYLLTPYLDQRYSHILGL